MDKLNELLKAMSLIEDDRKIPKEVVVDALKEAMAKAYKKHVEIPDINVRVDITPKGKIEIYQQYQVVEEVEDDELEISLEDAKETNTDAKIGDIVEHKVEINNFSRAAATLAKSVVKQKIREAEKQAKSEFGVGGAARVPVPTILILFKKYWGYCCREKLEPYDIFKYTEVTPMLYQNPDPRNRILKQIS